MREQKNDRAVYKVCVSVFYLDTIDDSKGRFYSKEGFCLWTNEVINKVLDYSAPICAVFFVAKRLRV